MSIAKNIAFVVVLSLLSSFAYAVPDNELRTRILEFTELLQRNEELVQTIERNYERLRMDNELLVKLLADIQKLSDQSKVKIISHELALEEMFKRINVTLQEIQSNNEDSIKTVSIVALGADTIAYEEAISIYQKQGDATRAIEILEKIAELDDLSAQTPAALHWLGRIYFEQRNFDLAKTNLETVIQKYPNAPREAESLSILIDIAVSENNPSVTTLIERLLNSFPNSYSADLVRIKHGALIQSASSI